MRVLLTGARGFVGRQIALALAARGAEIHAITSTIPAPDLPIHHWHVADLRDPVATSAAVNAARADTLVHAAWDTSHGLFWNADSNYSWVAASLALSDIFAKAGGERLIGVGSCAEYDWNYGVCSEALTPLSPIHPYGICKLALSRMWQAFAASHGLSFAWTRIFLVYGPHENRARFVPSVTLSLLRGETAACTSGEQLRDLLHVADAGRAIADVAYSAFQGAVNIGTGEPIKLKQVATEIGKVVGTSELLRFGALATRPSEPPILVPDIRVLTGATGFRPRFDLTEGLSDAVAWWRKKA